MSPNYDETVHQKSILGMGDVADSDYSHVDISLAMVTTPQPHTLEINV